MSVPNQRSAAEVRADEEPQKVPFPWSTLCKLAIIYLFGAAGRIGNLDSSLMLEFTRSLCRGHLWVEPMSISIEGVDGRHYSHYGVLTSLLWLPFVLLGRLAAGLSGLLSLAQWEEFFVSFASPMLATGCLVLMAQMWRRQGLDQRRIRAGLWLFGLSTLLWPYSKLPGSDLPMACLLLWASQRAWLAQRPGQLFWAGLLLGLALLARKQAQVLLPVFGLWFVWQLARRCSAAGRPATWLAAALAVGMGLLGPVLLQLGYNYARWGHPLVERYMFSKFERLPTLAEWGPQTWQVFFGSYHGWFIYNFGLVALLLATVPHWWRNQRETLVLWAGAAAASLGFVSLLDSHASVSFGSRFQLFLVPLAAWAWPWMPRLDRGWKMTLAGTVVGLSVLAQLPGVLVDPLPAVRRWELTTGMGGFLPKYHLLESARVLGIESAKLPPELETDTILRHPAFQNPDFWWWHVWKLARRHQSPSPQPTD